MMIIGLGFFSLKKIWISVPQGNGEPKDEDLGFVYEPIVKEATSKHKSVAEKGHHLRGCMEIPCGVAPNSHLLRPTLPQK
ncbi:hypothetical protein C5167_026354, partial [Papaver somniferum]